MISRLPLSPLEVIAANKLSMPSYILATAPFLFTFEPFHAVAQKDLASLQLRCTKITWNFLFINSFRTNRSGIFIFAHQSFIWWWREDAFSLAGFDMYCQAIHVQVAIIGSWALESWKTFNNIDLSYVDM